MCRSELRSYGSHRYAVKGQLRLDTLDRRDSLVQDTSDQRRVGVTAHQRVANVTRRPRASTRDHRDLDDFRDRRRQLEVVADTSPVAVDARDEELTRAAPNAFARPRNRIERRRRATAARVDHPSLTLALGIDTRDDAL